MESIRAMCNVKVIVLRNSQELMDILGLQSTVDRLANANGVQWCGHVVRRECDDVLIRALDFEIVRRRCRE